jgi:hypothetical protein
MARKARTSKIQLDALPSIVYRGGNVIDGRGEGVKLHNNNYLTYLHQYSAMYRRAKFNCEKRMIAEIVYKAITDSGASFICCDRKSKKGRPEAITKIMKSLKDLGKRQRQHGTASHASNEEVSSTEHDASSFDREFRRWHSGALAFREELDSNDAFGMNPPLQPSATFDSDCSESSNYSSCDATPVSSSSPYSALDSLSLFDIRWLGKVQPSIRTLAETATSDICVDSSMQFHFSSLDDDFLAMSPTPSESMTSDMDDDSFTPYFVFRC